MKRLILAVIFSPLITSALFSLVENVGVGRPPNFQLMIAILPIFYVFTLAGVIVLGLPVYYLLKKIGVLNLVSLTIAGALTGIIYMLLLYLIISAKTSSLDQVTFAAGAIMAAITALVFGVLAGIPLISSKDKLRSK